MESNDIIFVVPEEAVYRCRHFNNYMHSTDLMLLFCLSYPSSVLDTNYSTHPVFAVLHYEKINLLIFLLNALRIMATRCRIAVVMHTSYFFLLLFIPPISVPFPYSLLPILCCFPFSNPITYHHRRRSRRSADHTSGPNGIRL